MQDGRWLDEAVLKQMTGGDAITSRFLFKSEFEYRPQCKIILCCNHLPKIRGRDKGIWRRISVVPFTATLKKPDKELKTKLLAELPGILNWALVGCLVWQEQGLNPPKAVRIATSEYRGETDSVYGFITDCCIVADGLRQCTTTLYKAYEVWCAEEGRYPETLKLFGQQLSNLGYKHKKTGSGNWRYGLALSSG